MIKISEKFLLNLRKLKEYWVLRAEEDEIIIGTNITVNVHIEIPQTFSTYNENIKTTYPIYFLLTTLNKTEKLRKEFEKRNLLIKKIDNSLLNSSVENIKKALDQFIKNNLRS